MKKVVLCLICLISLIIPLKVSASSGSLKQDSIIECDGINYGYHSENKHYHKAVNKDGKWYAEGDIVEDVCEVSKQTEKE